jgi:hypothetical protein
MKDFNWDNLRFFLAMVRAGNPSAAARLLRVGGYFALTTIRSGDVSQRLNLISELDFLIGLMIAMR